jgi:hypothetical protein
MHGRYYDPIRGRFLSVDPMWDGLDLARPQTWNRFTYALNNPVLNVDPDGTTAITVPVVVGGVLLIAAGLYLVSESCTKGKSNAQAMGESATALFRAIARATRPKAEPIPIVKVEVKSRRQRPDRRVIGENVQRVFEAAPQLNAKPLILDASLDVVEGSRQAVAAAAVSGARIFDVGYDPARNWRSEPYAAERMELWSRGYRPVFHRYVIIQGELVMSWEWRKIR